MSTPHEGAVALSSKPAPAMEPAPGPVNMHPGPDLDTLQRVLDGLRRQPADSTEGSAAA